MKIVLATFFLVTAFATPAMARIFSLSNERFASYLLGSYGMSNLKTSPFDGETAQVNSYTAQYPNTLSGEFGFVYYSGQSAWRFGFEAIKPLKVEGTARSGGNADLYTYLNEVTVLTPKIGLDINFFTNSFYRFSLFGFYGMSSYSSKTDYYAVSISPGTAHSVEQRATAPCFGGGVTNEISFFDTTTFVLEVGYRQLKFSNIKYASDVTTFKGAITKGDEVVNSDDTKHEVDFSGVFVAAGIRVYLF